jgi:hypothetical protein
MVFSFPGKQGSGGLSSSLKPQDSAALPPPSSARKGLQRGTCRVRRFEKPILWDSCHICKNEVSFDPAQDRELVERPFHNLRRNGLSLKRDPQTPKSQNLYGTKAMTKMLQHASSAILHTFVTVFAKDEDALSLFVS